MSLLTLAHTFTKTSTEKSNPTKNSTFSESVTKRNELLQNRYVVCARRGSLTTASCDKLAKVADVSYLPGEEKISQVGVRFLVLTRLWSQTFFFFLEI